jgi:DNA/RNA-binding domain of Phe-tRNA-synthetase-like protein
MMNAPFVPFVPTVDPLIWEHYPDYRALSVVVRDFQPVQQLVAPPVVPANWCDAHIDAWREAYKLFGATPKKTPSSLESLSKRFAKEGQLPAISGLVDAYNALSLNFGAPFGGEDIAKYAGSPRLEILTESLGFDTAKDGVAIIEPVDPSEVVWRDAHGVTCRRWNWRQCKRTAITEQTRDLWFVIDRLAPMPLDSLRQAGDSLAALLTNASPSSIVAISLIEP